MPTPRPTRSRGGRRGTADVAAAAAAAPRVATNAAMTEGGGRGNEGRKENALKEGVRALSPWEGGGMGGLRRAGPLPPAWAAERGVGGKAG